MLDFYRFGNLEADPTLLHAVTTKSSTLPYGFSLALHTGEESSAIIKNREAVAQALKSRDLNFVVANQTHSDNIHIVTSHETKGWTKEADAIRQCDALVTQLKGVVLTILTADCVPILLHDPVRGVIAAIHAGWRGTHQEIALKTVNRMVEAFGTDPRDIVAGVAPSIGRCCYEVEEDVARHFKGLPLAYTQKGEKYMLDLPIINKNQLLDAGVAESNIEMSDICTACDAQRFFSYRKERGCSGRFMSMIARNQ